MIDGYRFGSMDIGGTTYQADLKIIGPQVIPNWWRKEGHKVYVEDILDLLKAQPSVLVIGRGSPGLMKPSDEVRRACQDKGIELIDEPTQEAVRIFNDLVKAGKKVAAAFHLTC
ncbi:Mth938-like domain-containing protein [Desulfosoma caldarium]|uniref:Uncharacterized protein n=1 Tax=Desulfosoma caldarium TaxID=610254 RepID=A0A3N1UVN1_9BACT|nr:MTH938/NDUFAF3 family protein [Desulfosoma caldarium]ROQ91216.1 hypothetical protein EDC27_2502 [Desulfosoma caldarium]